MQAFTPLCLYVLYLMSQGKEWAEIGLSKDTVSIHYDVIHSRPASHIYHAIIMYPTSTLYRVSSIEVVRTDRRREGRKEGRKEGRTVGISISSGALLASR
jgi:hypothetical protein